MKTKYWQEIGISALLFLVFLFLQFSEFSSIIDLKSQDLFRRGHAPHPDIVILAVDNKSLESIGRWPWKRSVHADILEALSEYNPQVLGYDVTFIDPDDPTDDEAFAEALKNTKFPVILAGQAIYQKGKRDPSRVLLPLSELRESQNVSVGIANILLSPDGLARSFPPVITKNNETYLPLSFQVITILNAVPPKESSLVSFAGSSGTFQTYSVSDLLERKIPQEALQGKIVLLGATAGDLRDILLVPGTRQILSGVEYHANVIDNILLSRGITIVPKAISLGVGFLLLFSSLALFFFVSARKTFFIAVSIALFLPLSSWVLWQMGYSFSYIGSALFLLSFILTQGLYRWYTTSREKRQLRGAFQNYFSPQILEYIVNHPENLSLGGKKAEITVLFCDLRNFTSMSEKLSPEELTEFLNEYFTEMTEEILATDGVVDKFIGDAIMAIWGAPLEQEDQADRALRAAKGMLHRLGSLQKRWKEKGFPEINMGIGIHSGEATIGNMGSKKRFDYTAIGNTVNLASRLEGLNKEYDCQIVLSEETKEKLKEHHEFKSLGTVKVKGKTIPTKIYTLSEKK